MPSNQPQFRRKVKTGESVYKRFAKPATSVRTSYGMRIVCNRCIRYLSLEEMRADLIWLGKVVLALVVVFLLLLFPNLL